MHDSSAAPVAFGGGIGREFSGPHNLHRRTFADELRKQSRREPSIISVALKPRSAIALAGRGSSSTIAVWEEDDGTWATSTAYTKKPRTATPEGLKAGKSSGVWNSTHFCDDSVYETMRGGELSATYTVPPKSTHTAAGAPNVTRSHERMAHAGVSVPALASTGALADDSFGEDGGEDDAQASTNASGTMDMSSRMILL